MSVKVPTRDMFRQGCREFQKHEPRGSMYRVASLLVRQSWGRPAEMADGLGVLLWTWNQAFYRYGPFSFEELERCIRANLSVLATYRNKSILALQKSDEQEIERLFIAFLDALKIAEGKGKGRSSPVAVAKALHLLGPSFFPLWDQAIALAYGCKYNVQPAETYIRFCYITAEIARKVQEYEGEDDESLLKRIDEYNYAKFTQHWV